MTVLQAYVAFGIPAIALLMGGGALWLTNVSWEREEKRARASSLGMPGPRQTSAE